jgi:hypothetical protein
VRESARERAREREREKRERSELERQGEKRESTRRCLAIDFPGNSRKFRNCLQETISGRQFDMMDETVLVNTIKERLCFVSTRYRCHQ